MLQPTDKTCIPVREHDDIMALSLVDELLRSSI
jgi:hypothetical protein